MEFCSRIKHSVKKQMSGVSESQGWKKDAVLETRRKVIQ